LDFLQNMFFVGLEAGSQESGQPMELSKRQIYNAVIDSPELLGKGLELVIESFNAKAMPEGKQAGSKKKASQSNG